MRHTRSTLKSNDIGATVDVRHGRNVAPIESPPPKVNEPISSLPGSRSSHPSNSGRSLSNRLILPIPQSPSQPINQSQTGVQGRRVIGHIQPSSQQPNLPTLTS